MYRKAIGLLILCLALALAACSSPEPDSGGARGADPDPPSDESTATVAVAADMLGINELITQRTAIQTTLLVYALYMPLLEEEDNFRDGPPTFAPRLAESYEFSDDHLQLTFNLREDAVWSDGVPITAEDVRWTFEAQTHPDVAWDYAEVKERITEVEVVDPHTVRFHFSETYSAQLLDANEGVILPKHAWSGLPFSDWRSRSGWFFDHRITSGPYVLESRRPQERIVLSRNERYFEPGVPAIEKVVMQVVPDQTSLMAMLRSGTIDIAEVTPQDVAQLETDPDLRIITYQPRQFVYLCWNHERPQFEDRRVRRALTQAIDRQGLIDTLYYGLAQVADSPYSANTWVRNRELEPLPYDPEKARELLDEAGWHDADGDGIRDKDGVPFRFELVTNNDNSIRGDILVLVQKQLGEVGIEVQARSIEFNSMVSRLFSGEFDAVLSSVGIDTSLNLYNTFHTGAAEGGHNFGRYSNPEVDRLIKQLEAQIEQAPALPLYHELQALIHTDQPITFLYEPRRPVAVNRQLENVKPTAISTFANMRYWRWASDD